MKRCLCCETCGALEHGSISCPTCLRWNIREWRRRGWDPSTLRTFLRYFTRFPLT